MAPWTGLVLAPREPESGPPGSRLFAYLHPLAGRPRASAPVRVVVAGGCDLTFELFADVPGERRVDASWIGSGGEPGGFNDLSHTSIRNRAILEPYVRRGFDE